MFCLLFFLSQAWTPPARRKRVPGVAVSRRGCNSSDSEDVPVAEVKVSRHAALSVSAAKGLASSHPSLPPSLPTPPTSRPRRGRRGQRSPPSSRQVSQQRVSEEKSDELPLLCRDPKKKESKESRNRWAGDVISLPPRKRKKNEAEMHCRASHHSSFYPLKTQWVIFALIYIFYIGKS